MWYESNRDIDAGEEIVIDGRPKTLFDQNEFLSNGELQNGSSINSSDDRSERDNSKCVECLFTTSYTLAFRYKKFNMIHNTL